MYLSTKSGRQVEVTDIEYGNSLEETRISFGFYTDIEDAEEAIVEEEVLEELTNDNFDALANAWYDRMEAHENND